MNSPVSLKQQLLTSNSDLPPNLVALIDDVASACRNISALVTRGAMAGVLGDAGSENVQGEGQKKLDVISNDVFIDKLQWSGNLAGMASEEMDDMHPIPAAFTRGDYLITFDPLDGSSNIDVNGSVGTIFSIMQAPAGDVNNSSFLQPGNRQVCAGYCLYSSASMLVLTTGNGVDGFTLDVSSGEFLLTHADIRVPAETSEFSINAAYTRHWFAPVKRYIDEALLGSEGPRGRNFNMRWAGSMVGDVHRILMRGGVFMYPADKKLAADNKAGKLRLLYEASPMGMLMEQAGGLASTGNERILDIQPDSLHQRVPVIMGSATEVELVDSYHSEAS